MKSLVLTVAVVTVLTVGGIVLYEKQSGNAFSVLLGLSANN